MDGTLDGTSYSTYGFKLNGKDTWRYQLAVDYNYFEMLGLTILQGRSFSEKFPTDTISSRRASVVNEILFHLLGKEAKLGEYNKTIRSTIVGVVKDYHFEGLTKKIAPEEHVLSDELASFGAFLFKIKAGQMPKTIDGLKKEWRSATRDYPFEYTFLDRQLADMYKSDLRWQQMIQVSCFFALFIACMGLFGLSAINAVNRTKEIGIRKVLGATVRDIVASLSSQCRHCQSHRQPQGGVTS